MYEIPGVLREDAKIVSRGGTAEQHQSSLDDQLRDLYTLANKFGLYDAADFIRSVAKGQPS